MRRRDFLFSLSAAALLATTRRVTAQAGVTPPVEPIPGGGPLPLPRPASPPAAKPVFTPLRRNVGVFTARGGTIGWLSSGDALAAIDSKFPDTAAQFLAGLPGRGERKLDVLINTHHHGDHTGGNGVFKPVAQHIVAQAHVPDLQRRAAERAKPPTVDQQVYADQTFDDTWHLSLGGEEVSAKFLGPAHTGGDIVVVFEKANVVHLGDLVFNRMYPVTDRFGGVNLRNWARVLEKVIQDYPADAIYVFGHGNPKFGVTGKREDLTVMHAYLTRLVEHVQKEISAGKTKEEIVTLKEFPGFPDFAEPGPNTRLPINLGVAYDELMAKPS